MVVQLLPAAAVCGVQAETGMVLEMTPHTVATYPLLTDAATGVQVCVGIGPVRILVAHVVVM